MESWFFSSWKEELYFERLRVWKNPVSTLVLHGAWTWDTTRTSALRNSLAIQGISTLAIDFSGHGKSKNNSFLSIQKRIEEAKEAIHLLDSTENITLIGFSMSGEVCIRLTEYFSVANIILFAPGIYHRDAIDVHFWTDFSSIIRQYESWKNTDVDSILNRYEWSLLLITPELDIVIPEWVNTIILSNHHAKNKRIVVSDAPHMIWKWMNENKDRAQELATEIHQFIN